MKYQIDNIEIKTVNDQPNGNKYVLMSLSDPDDLFNEPCVVAVFTEAVVKFYEKALSEAHGVFANLPEKAKWFPHAVWVTIPLSEPMFRRWGRAFDTTDKNGVVTHHNADDYINDKDGNPKLYTEFRVLCKETVDKEKMEAGYSAKEATTWAKGWDPVSRGNSYISSFFVRPTAGGSTEQAPAQQPAPTSAPQPQAPQAGVQQPGVQQGVTAPQAPVV